MVAALCRSFAVVVLLVASSASAVTVTWTPIGNPGNACDSQPGGCFGAVDYAYDISTYEITNAQYAEFLNAKAASDPLGLYNPLMATQPGGITRTGVSGSFVYTVVTGRGEIPVNNVSIYDSMRFANWIQNGQGGADTETGAYTLLGGTAVPTNEGVTRNFDATIVLANENEWHKAAYYDPATGNYFDYPAGSDLPTGCSTPTAAPNSANCQGEVNNLVPKGSYTGSASPNGTFDQGGNVQEWTENVIGENRILRGGGYNGIATRLGAFSRAQLDGSASNVSTGIRLVQLVFIPEPGTGLLLFGGLIALACRRRA
jgi:formylglycine-generating enzyme required for sulfatase activity